MKKLKQIFYTISAFGIFKAMLIGLNASKLLECAYTSHIPILWYSVVIMNFMTALWVAVVWWNSLIESV
jgi:hypothetical protein